jgi:formylmethanofuran--tetrahydromethanopterin N-formyltransferase
MKIGQTEIVDTFAEAFGMRFTRLILTAANEYWLRSAATEFCGFGASVIACDVEAGVEQWLSAEETPDGRLGASLLVFAFSTDALAKSVPTRAGQCLMTCASTAVFNGLVGAEKSFSFGSHLRFFGDGFQQSKLLGSRRFWRVPVMDGEFLVEERLGVGAGVAGGNFIIEAVSQNVALESAERAVKAMENLPGVITPFPGGVARSGSKVGSRYASLKASTADAFCPTLKGRVQSQLHTAATAACEIVIDGMTESAVAAAMQHGIAAAVGEGVCAISAGNYGGKLGKFHLHLKDVIPTAKL